MKKFHLVHKDGWILLKDNISEPVQDYRGESKSQALKWASEYLMALSEPCSLLIYKEDGSLEDDKSFNTAV